MRGRKCHLIALSLQSYDKSRQSPSIFLERIQLLQVIASYCTLLHVIACYDPDFCVFSPSFRPRHTPPQTVPSYGGASLLPTEVGRLFWGGKLFFLWKCVAPSYGGKQNLSSARTTLRALYSGRFSALGLSFGESRIFRQRNTRFPPSRRRRCWEPAVVLPSDASVM